MAVYGQSIYGKDYYGVDAAVSFSVGDVSANQTGNNEVTLTWTTPTSQQDWTQLQLVRNTTGYPATETDGTILLSFLPGAVQNIYVDSGLTGGRYYYYAIFLASAFPAYSASITYQTGDTVSYNGSNWLCTAANTVGVTPSAGANWAMTNSLNQWNYAGQAAALAVPDAGYTDLLYSLLPSPYATTSGDITDAEVSTTPLHRYLSVLGWGLSTTRAELGDTEHLARVATMPLTRLELLAQQLGVPQEASITPRLRRYRVANSALLARERGTLDSIREEIYTTTGWDAEISTSRNLLLNCDQSEARYPRYAAWDPSVIYQPGTVVSYGGYLYTAQSSTVRVEAELCTLTGPNVIQPSLPGAVYSNNQQVLFQTNAPGQSVTLTFTVPATASYDIAAGMTVSYDYGITNFAIDGTTASNLFHPIKWNGYAPGYGPATSLYLGYFALAAGSHTLTLTVVGKAANSGTNPKSNNNGYQIGIDYLTYTPTSVSNGLGTAPTGTATSNAFWSYTTGLVTHALDNPLTEGISTWEMISFTAGVTAANSSLSVVSGYQSLTGTGDHTANLLLLANPSGSTPATLSAHSIPHAQATTWSTSTTYPAGSYVTYSGQDYLALLPSQGAEPDADLAHWQPVAISTSGPDRYLVSSYGIPLLHTPVWTAGAQYASGDIVAYGGQRYIAASPNSGSAPTGYPTDTTVWCWLGHAQDAYTVSAYSKTYSGTGTPAHSMYIEWFDATGNLITTITPTTNSAADLIVPFSTYSSDLATDPGAQVDLNGHAWTTSSTDTPVAASGMAFWSTRSDPNGRQLVTNYGQSDVSLGLTFATAPPSAIEHGLCFRWTALDTFWGASRTRLTKVVGGTVTTLASWSALPDGARIVVVLSGSSITVSAYQGPGLSLAALATVTDAQNSTATQHGIFERAS